MAAVGRPLEPGGGHCLLEDVNDGLMSIWLGCGGAEGLSNGQLSLVTSTEHCVAPELSVLLGMTDAGGTVGTAG